MKWLPVALAVGVLGLGTVFYTTGLPHKLKSLITQNVAQSEGQSQEDSDFKDESGLETPDLQTQSQSSSHSLHRDSNHKGQPLKRPRPDINSGDLKKSGKTFFSYPGKKLVCPLKHKPSLFALVQIEYRYHSESLREELIFKESDMEALVQNIIYQASASQLTAPWLRGQLVRLTNKILTSGSIEDIVFTDFRIEIRNKTP